MRVLDRRHLDVRILINHAGADIMAVKQPRDWNRTTSVRNSDFRTQSEILHGRFDQRFRPGWPIDVDWLSPIQIPCDGHERPETCRMIVMMMGNENDTHVPDVDSGFDQTANDAIAGVNNIVRARDDQQD